MVACDNNCGPGGRGVGAWGRGGVDLRSKRWDALEADLREQDCLQSGAAETLSRNWANPSSPHSTSKKVCALEGLMESHGLSCCPQL